VSNIGRPAQIKEVFSENMRIEKVEKAENLNRGKDLGLQNVIYTIKNEIPQKEFIQETESISRAEKIDLKNAIIELRKINEELKGEAHPITDVPFKEKTVENLEGKKVTAVFPDFKDYKEFEVKLPVKLYLASDNQQFEFCNEKLKKSYEKGTLNLEKFTDRQIAQIKDGLKPDGYTWHHNEKIGKMEMVRSDIHGATGHVGGRTIWGGGQEAR